MDFRLGAESDAFREEASEFLDRADDRRSSRSGCTARACPTTRASPRPLRDRGWLAPGWPVEWGGQGRDPLEMMAFHEEMQRVHAPSYGIGTTMMVARVISKLGTEEQKDGDPPAAPCAARSSSVLGFTEPEAGSDVAAAQCRAVRDGDEWVINGQKMFTTNGHIGDYVFLLTRTNPDVPKHKGLTTFLVPTEAAAVSRPRPCSRSRASGPTSRSTATSASRTAAASARSTRAGR